VVVADPSHGTVALGADGSFTYTPDAGYHGPDSFTYRPNDGNSDGNTATVTITVDAPPVAVDDTYTTAENTVLSKDAAAGVLANDTDADGDPITAVVVADPSHGTVALGADGSFTYTPDAGYHGPDSFTYVPNDGIADGNIATVNITVDAPPVAVDDSYTTDAGTGLPVTLAANGVLANDTDADGDPLTSIAVTQPANGTLFLFASGLNADGTFTYYPNIGFVGTDSFTYKVNDGTADGNTATVTIHVNGLPVAADDGYTAVQDTPLTEDAGAGVLANDAGTGTLTAVVVADPAHGTVALNADGSFTYTPSAGYRGTDSFTYKVNDGIADGNTATVNITVDTPPVAANDSYTTVENTVLNKDAGSGLLANDTGTGTLTAVVVADPAHGAVALNADGSFTYTPSAGYRGPDSFTYRPNDGTADGNTATVNIIVDAPPVAVDDSYTTGENTPLSATAAQGVLANDTDADGDTLTAVVVADPAHGAVALNADGSFTYTPSAGFFGSDSFTYLPSDGTTTGAPTTVSLTVTQASLPPAFALAGMVGTVTGHDRVGFLATNTSTPTITGYAPPGYTVVLFEQSLGFSPTIHASGSSAAIGQAVAGADGKFRITSQALPDGSYNLSVTAFNPNTPGSTMLTGPIGGLTVDTAAPQILGTALDRDTGRFYVTFHDATAGMNLASVLNPAKYLAFWIPAGSNRVHEVKVKAVIPIGSVGGLETVAVVVGDGAPIRRGRMILVAHCGRIVDGAGNSLQAGLRRLFPVRHNQQPAHRSAGSQVSPAVRTASSLAGLKSHPLTRRTLPRVHPARKG
jgi:VCBS repeat-containing protein